MNYKRLLSALGGTILAVATLHIILLVIYAFSSGDFVYLNMAKIIDLKLFFKDLEYTPLVAVIACLPVGILFLYLYFKKKPSV